MSIKVLILCARALRVVVSIKGAIHAEHFAPWCFIVSGKNVINIMFFVLFYYKVVLPLVLLTHLVS